MLKIEHLFKSYGSKKILDDVSLHINQGEIAVLLGSSGVGKSTLLRVLNNLEQPDSGTFSLDGKPFDIAQANKNHLVGFVFQNFNLFENLSVEQNITLALEKVGNKTAAQAKQIAHDLLTHYGLADKKNASVASLSGGQKQRLALARTLALKPHIICLDEPTSALDPLLTSHVAKSIQELAQQGYIVLVATHDTSLIERLPATIYLMHEGKIIQSATTQQLQQNPEHYSAITQFISGNSAT
ncbi:MAG: amino acid ABC transporter ATP-binding protein [Candidatus Dependentiae bacterium]